VLLSLIVLISYFYKKRKTASALRLLWETNTTDVMGLASVFGMGTGVSPLLWPSLILYDFYAFLSFSKAIFAYSSSFNFIFL